MRKKISNKNRLLFTIIGLCSLVALSSCGKGPESSEKLQPPAKIDNPVKETALATITLSPQAEKRLGIEVAKGEIRPLPESLALGGEIVSVPGKEIRASAPAPGTILGPENTDLLLPGATVKKGEPILRLLLMPPDKDLIGAREDVAVKQEQYDVARAKAERAKELLAVKAISEKANEDVQVELTKAGAALNAAVARLNLLTGTDIEEAAQSLSTLILESPVDGVLRRLLVSRGQTVAASTELFEVVGLDTVWVRVPVYAGDLDDIDVRKPASVRLLGQGRSPESVSARPVAGPPLSDPESASSDLYYEIGNNERLFRVGQKVAVSLIKKSVEDVIAVPWSAILYDFNGGTWVYVKIADHIYSRSRVEISHIVDGYAAVTRGLAEGSEVVTAGAAELFGTEFGVGK